jgi:hypothetical protein
MDKVEGLKYCFGVSEGCQDYQQMENLVARAKYIKSSSTPSLGHLGQSQPT